MGRSYLVRPGLNSSCRRRGYNRLLDMLQALYFETDFTGEHRRADVTPDAPDSHRFLLSDPNSRSTSVPAQLRNWLAHDVGRRMRGCGRGLTVALSTRGLRGSRNTQ